MREISRESYLKPHLIVSRQAPIDTPPSWLTLEEQKELVFLAFEHYLTVGNLERLQEYCKKLLAADDGANISADNNADPERLLMLGFNKYLSQTHRSIAQLANENQMLAQSSAYLKDENQMLAQGNAYLTEENQILARDLAWLKAQLPQHGVNSD